MGNLSRFYRSAPIRQGFPIDATGHQRRVPPRFGGLLLATFTIQWGSRFIRRQARLWREARDTPTHDAAFQGVSTSFFPKPRLQECVHLNAGEPRLATGFRTPPPMPLRSTTACSASSSSIFATPTAAGRQVRCELFACRARAPIASDPRPVRVDPRRRPLVDGTKCRSVRGVAP